MGKITRKLKSDDIGDMGIGAMIVFIAMDLVAGIAASVLIQTANRLEIQAMQTGQETIGEVSSGLAVTAISGHRTDDADDNLDLMTITIQPRSGSFSIDLEQTYIELSDSNNKVVLAYDLAEFVDTPGIDGDFFTGTFFDTLTSTTFSIITEAHRSGGKFILRVDDTQKYWLNRFGTEKVDELAGNFYQDLKEFMKIDYFYCQHVGPDITRLVDIPRDFLKLIRKPMFQHDQIPEWITSPDMEMYPYAPMYTLEKVIWDYYEGVRWLIRGEDLVSEFSLYSHFVDVLGLPRVRHTYIPRLRTQENKELMEISKSLRSYILRDQVEKFGVDGVLEFLAKSCLKNPEGEFVVENIKCQPTIVGFKAS